MVVVSETKSKKEIYISSWKISVTKRNFHYSREEQSMTIKELLDVWDKRREDEYQEIHIMDNNGRVALSASTNCELLDEIEDKEILSINIPAQDIIEVWLKKQK